MEVLIKKKIHLFLERILKAVKIIVCVKRRVQINKKIII